MARDIKRGDTVKGFEVEKGRYAIITEEDLEALEPESSTSMEITSTGVEIQALQIGGVNA